MNKDHEIPPLVLEFAKQHFSLFERGHMEYLGKYKKSSVYSLVMDDDGFYGLPQLLFYKKNIWGKYKVRECRLFPTDVIIALSEKEEEKDDC